MLQAHLVLFNLVVRCLVRMMPPLLALGDMLRGSVKCMREVSWLTWGRVSSSQWRAQELRIEDCTSGAGAEPAPWEDTMRVMPPLLELADMFNLILRRCRASRADSDLVRGGQGCAKLKTLHLRDPCRKQCALMLLFLKSSND